MEEFNWNQFLSAFVDIAIYCFFAIVLLAVLYQFSKWMAKKRFKI
jgi:hypothetical protein